MANTKLRYKSEVAGLLCPTAWPRRGAVKRLYLNFAGANGAKVFLQPVAWPRNATNPRWSFAVEGIDARYDLGTQDDIRSGCLADAKAGLGLWLEQVAPALTVETASWLELVRFATQPEERSRAVTQLRRRKKIALAATETVVP